MHKYERLTALSRFNGVTVNPDFIPVAALHAVFSAPDKRRG
jgi:hypothetical protein